MSQAAEQIRFCVSRDRTRIAYAVSGAGYPVLFVQDWVHHVKFDWDSELWRPWLALLAQGHRLLRYDFRGLGLSDRERIQFSHERHVEDLAAVADAAGLERFAIVAMAGGCAKAVSYAVRHPQRVTHLVLFGPPTRGRLAGNPSARLLEESDVRLKAIELGWPNEIHAYGHFLASLQIPDASPAIIRSFNDLLRRTTSPTNATALLRGYWQVDVTDSLPKISCPTLVLHAREDSTIPFEEGRKVAGLIPDARFVPLDSRDHILVASEPAWRLLAAALEEFLPGAAAFERPLADLTARECNVLELVAGGLDNYEIATRLGIREKTVRNHVTSVLSKLGAKSRAQAVARARDAGFGQRVAR
ncbi:MAG TPA: alpha/beta fold hydrolase [Stellaceae bacterium]|jgi:pimeloyl-ACP methyl ester carboxylesterase/DNA-binding CsgD family transcriptional regulator|nr:alpha/beta fold hydrolase [Stellaceae bacterium]